MNPEPPADYTPPPPKPRIYLSASNHAFLALKIFGYSVLGYLLIVIPIIVLAFVIGSINNP